jgi:hypothetical protein
VVGLFDALGTPLINPADGDTTRYGRRRPGDRNIEQRIVVAEPESLAEAQVQEPNALMTWTSTTRVSMPASIAVVGVWCCRCSAAWARRFNIYILSEGCTSERPMPIRMGTAAFQAGSDRHEQGRERVAMKGMSQAIAVEPISPEATQAGTAVEQLKR